VSALSDALGRLHQIVGEEHLLTDTAAVGRHVVDGQTPAAVVFPGTGEEVAALLRAAAEMKLSVLLSGAGHHLYLGAPAAPIGLVVSLTRLNRIVEYDAGDLTITAQAGMSLAALSQAVAEQGQALPLDPPGPATATLGGIVAGNLSGPMRVRYGTARDLVLGMRVALTTGEVVRTGGRTVKNVAGYDLSKLFVGSLGTLGAILELTLRLVPAPEQRAVMLTAMPRQGAMEVASRVASSPWEITACEVLNPTAVARLRPYLPPPGRPDACAVCVGLGGSREAVRRQQQEISSLVGHGAVCFEGGDADRVWERVRGIAYPTDANGVLLRASVLPSAIGDVLALVSSHAGWSALVHAGDGIVYASPDRETDITAIKKAVGLVRQTCEEAGGFAVLEAAPVELKREVGVWGRGLVNSDVMKQLKLAYDPAGMLGCGRLV